ncbi:hypothetical protein [Bradyrhizobium iriomotense]|uniref:hypothetical protein n=1 Tax=Bradyrhizobium iriomotense TaxID=441950 RepID=UPI0024E042D6|nr:hypothetical protein [Bradyrhizobium iriomotense]
MTLLQRVDGEFATFEFTADVMLVDRSVYPLALERQLFFERLQERLPSTISQK